jgi:8-oxo-dGTP pyrophosphatase MutT (NUDIX family)
MKTLPRITLTAPLPGEKAQLEMAAKPSGSGPARLAPEGAMHAAVLALLTPLNEGGNPQELLDWEVLLIRRNSYAGVHSGQIALPGGKREETDQSFWETACRESFEEIGARRADFSRIGPLSSLYVASSNCIIHPFLALNKAVDKISPDPREVADYKNIAVKTFDPARAGLMTFHSASGQKQAPAWEHDGYTIWGATAMILAELYRAVVRGSLGRL